MKRIRKKYWCDEDVLSLVIMDILRLKSFNLILGNPPLEMRVCYSKADLLKASARLSSTAIQGRNCIDLSAYKDQMLLLGIIISRLYIASLVKDIDHTKKIIRFLLSTPEDAEKAYLELKDIGYNISSVNIAKLYKTLVLARSIAKLYRVYNSSNCLSILIVIPCLRINEISQFIDQIVNRLIKYVIEEHEENREIVYMLVCFRPNEIARIPPSIVYLDLIKDIDSSLFSTIERIPFIEIMGYDYYGCAKCRYSSICIKMLR